MSLGGIILAAVGAILAFAVKDHISGVELHTVGLIMIAAGALAFLIGLFEEASWARRLRGGGRVEQAPPVVQQDPRVVERDPRL